MACVAATLPGPNTTYAKNPEACGRAFDFTQIEVTPRPGHVLSSGRVSSTDVYDRLPVTPLDVAITGFDKQSYAINELFDYGLRLTNNSPQTVLLPVSPQPVYPVKGVYPRGYRHLYLEFMVEEANGRAVVVDRYTTYGSRGRRGSLRRLKPGQCVEVKLPGFFQIYLNAQRYELLDKARTDVKASVNVYLYDPRDEILSRNTKPAVSNKFPIAIRGQEVPVVERKYRKRD